MDHQCNNFVILEEIEEVQIDQNLLINSYFPMCELDDGSQVDDSIQDRVIYFTEAHYQSLCSDYVEKFELEIDNLKRSIKILENQVGMDRDYALSAVDSVANKTSQLLGAARSAIWRAVRNDFDTAATLQSNQPIPDIEKMIEGFETCAITAASAKLLIRYVSSIINPPLSYDLDVDDTGNILINWHLESYSYEWTVAKCDDPWPMITVFEYCRKKTSENEIPTMRTWHNAKSIGERLKEVHPEHKVPRVE